MALFATETWTMRHRLLLNFRAKSEGVDADRIIQGLVKAVR